MFGFLKSDPKKKLQAEFERLSKKAMEAQQNGNIELFGELSQKAEEIGQQLDQLNKDQEKGV
ncbi:MAG: DUF6435 family protein [Bacteriovoracaceae bacterium]|nr:DUF6435 family protein [Bacteriovoracaceae bacterium]